jgi:antitoxin VapB
MTTKAKIFTNGGSQAVRLPKSCRFPEGQREVLVRREGNRVILEPVNEWPQEVIDLIGSIDEDLPRLRQRTVTRPKKRLR